MTTTLTPRSATDPATVLRCASTADFLAALPFLAGFTAENSLFLVLFEGRRSHAAVRMDLPDRLEPGATGPFVDAVLEILRETGAGPEGPALVITSAQTFAESDGPPWRHLARILKRRFRREGWPLRELAVVAADGWAGLLDPDAPRLGRPLSEIKASPILAQAAEAEAAPLPLDRLGLLPETDPVRDAAVVAVLAELDCRAPAGDASGPRSAWLRGIARVADACLDARSQDPARPIESRLCARLICASESSDGWLVLALAAVTGYGFVNDLFDGPSPAWFSALPVDDGLGIPGGGGDPTGRSLRLLLSDVALEQPNLERLRCAIAVLEEAAAHAPIARRSGLMALLAWAWWMRGMQSVAARLVDQALEMDADGELGLMVQRLVEQAPGWQFNAFPFAEESAQR